MKNTTVINNSVIDDKQLSLKALGLYIFMKRQPSTFLFTLRGITEQLGKNSLDSVRTGMLELRKFNIVSFSRNADGTVDYKLLK